MARQARSAAARKTAGRRGGAAKKTASRKTAAKKGGARKTPARKAPAKKAPARKAAAKRSAGKSAMHMPGWFNDALSSTLGREALAAALIAGAGAAAAVLAKRGAGGKIKSAVSEASDATREFAEAATDAFVSATSGAVRSFLPRSDDEDDEFDRS